jgi:hypothetical protein
MSELAVAEQKNLVIGNMGLCGGAVKIFVQILQIISI